MGDVNSNDNFANAITALESFSGKDPKVFVSLYEKTNISLGIPRPDIHNVVEGQVRTSIETASVEAEEKGSLFEILAVPGDSLA